MRPLNKRDELQPFVLPHVPVASAARGSGPTLGVKSVLLIKQMLRIGEAEAHRNAQAASFMERVQKVAFLATPHTGADLAGWSDQLRVLVRPSAATISLVRNDPNLRDLNL